jgi:hypothetical protein
VGEAASVERRVDLGVGEGDLVLGELVLGETGQLVAVVDLVAVLVRVVMDGDGHVDGLPSMSGQEWVSAQPA